MVVQKRQKLPSQPAQTLVQLEQDGFSQNLHRVAFAGGTTWRQTTHCCASAYWCAACEEGHRPAMTALLGLPPAVAGSAANEDDEKDDDGNDEDEDDKEEGAEKEEAAPVAHEAADGTGACTDCCCCCRCRR